MSEKVEFGFRVWVHPDDGDPVEIETWFQGLESTDDCKLPVSDWARESLGNEDFHALFDLDKSKHWQVVGKGTLCGAYGHCGEYDEEFDVIEFQMVEVPESWFRVLARYRMYRRKGIAIRIGF